MMKFRHQVVCVLPVVMLACGLLPAPARAQFIQQGPKLVGTGGVGTTFQGISVSLSDDGSAAIVGAPGDSGFVGATWVFTRSGGVWSQEGPKLVGSDGVGAARQGVSASLSADGDTAIVGGVTDNGLTGAAWVYTRSGGMWSEQAKLVATDAIGSAEQGGSVSLSADGNTAIVGGINDNNFTGAAWVFTRSGGMWNEQAKLVATDAIGSAGQGRSVSLSADGNTAIVGGANDNVLVGAAWVFTRSGGVWNEDAKLVATDAIGGAAQGQSVSLSADGSTAIVGGPGDDSVGAAWVFARSGGVWRQQAKLVGTGSVGTPVQGFAVSLSGDGNTAVVGGPQDNKGLGAMWVFTRSGGVWSQQGPKVVGAGATGGVAGTIQGSSVSLSRDGRTAIVGGPADNNDIGATWVFIQPLFAGTPGQANCIGQSVSALASQFGGFNAAAAALGYSGVGALQNAILTFCGE
jgi:hypothetical protein